jgi:hypothetical protein
MRSTGRRARLTRESWALLALTVVFVVLATAAFLWSWGSWTWPLTIWATVCAAAAGWCVGQDTR